MYGTLRTESQMLFPIVGVSKGLSNDQVQQRLVNVAKLLSLCSFPVNWKWINNNKLCNYLFCVSFLSVKCTPAMEHLTSMIDYHVTLHRAFQFTIRWLIIPRWRGFLKMLHLKQTTWLSVVWLTSAAQIPCMCAAHFEWRSPHFAPSPSLPAATAAARDANRRSKRNIYHWKITFILHYILFNQQATFPGQDFQLSELRYDDGLGPIPKRAALREVSTELVHLQWFLWNFNLQMCCNICTVPVMAWKSQS